MRVWNLLFSASQASGMTMIPKSGIGKVQGFCVVHLKSRSEEHAEEELMLTSSSTQLNVMLVLLSHY